MNDNIKEIFIQVRQSTMSPIVLAHTKNDDGHELDMMETCDICERLSVAGWETCR